MKIVIAGAGDVGFHLAELLETQNQDITLIDLEEPLLDYAATHLDVMTVQGDVSSLEVLRNSGVANAKLFIAVTTQESTNLLVCILAKKLGAKQTIARVSNPEYLEKGQREYFQQIGVDNIFAPTMLAAKEIQRLISRVSATDVFEFEDGKISIIGFTVDNSSYIAGESLRAIRKHIPDNELKIILVLRNDQTIIPTPDLVIEASDHLYIATGLKDFESVNKYFGKTLQKVKKIMIIGDTRIALYTAQLLEKDYAITMVAKREATCKKFVEVLEHALVIEGNPANTDLLKEEGLKDMDALIALTPNSELNIISCLMAEKAGVYKTIALVDNSAYTHISQSIGVDTLINKKILAANNIFRFVRKGRIEAIASFHGVDAEIIEFVIHKSNRITRNRLDDLKLPDDAIIAGVIRDEKGVIPSPDFILDVGDKVIVCVLPAGMKRVEEIFK
jgi:trk system potassium uptake protein TrkA